MIEIDRGSGYIVRAPDGTFRRIPLPDPWAAPALMRVELADNPVWTAMTLFAWLAHPGVNEADEKRRGRALQVLAAWQWRSLHRFGRVRKRDMPAYAKAIREDRVLPACEKLRKRINTRLEAAGMLMWLALGQVHGVKASVRGRAPSAKWLSEVSAGSSPEGNPAEDIRKRVWQHSRRVLHVADAMRVLIPKLDNKSDLWGRLLGHPDWVADLLVDAEGRRRNILPTIGISTATEHTIQFRPRRD